MPKAMHLFLLDSGTAHKAFAFLMFFWNWCLCITKSGQGFVGSTKGLCLSWVFRYLCILLSSLQEGFFFGGEDLKQKISSILPVYLYFYCQILGKLSKHFASFVWDHGSQPFTSAVCLLQAIIPYEISSLNPNIYFNWQLCLVVQIRSFSI